MTWYICAIPSTARFLAADYICFYFILQRNFRLYGESFGIRASLEVGYRKFCWTSFYFRYGVFFALFSFSALPYGLMFLVFWERERRIVGKWALWTNMSYVFNLEILLFSILYEYGSVPRYSYQGPSYFYPSRLLLFLTLETWNDPRLFLFLFFSDLFSITWHGKIRGSLYFSLLDLLFLTNLGEHWGVAILHTVILGQHGKILIGCLLLFFWDRCPQTLCTFHDSHEDIRSRY